MKKKSPLSADEILFCAYDRDQTFDLKFIDQFPFDGRHDFLADSSLAGIAVRVFLSNDRSDRGARRDVMFTLVDMTIRSEAACHAMRICLPADSFRECHMFFAAETSALVAGHTYKLLVRDKTSGETIGMNVLHLFDKTEMGDPTEWYNVCDAGVRPSWEDALYKSLDTDDGHEYLVQFNVSPQMGCGLPSVLPELEMRLHYLDGKNVKVFFKEPFCRNVANFEDNRWTVECPFVTVPDINGVFYAELLCMEYAIAGFVFDTMSSEAIRGSWYGPELESMDRFTYRDARTRIDRFLLRGPLHGSAPEPDPFDEALDRFIASETEQLSES